MEAPALPQREDAKAPDDLLKPWVSDPSLISANEVVFESTARQHLRLAATGAAGVVLAVLAAATFLVVSAFINLTDDVIAYAFSDADWMLTPLVALTTTLVVALVVITIALVRSAFGLTTPRDGMTSPHPPASTNKDSPLPLPGIELVKSLAESLSAAIKALGRVKSP